LRRRIEKLELHAIPAPALTGAATGGFEHELARRAGQHPPHGDILYHCGRAIGVIAVSVTGNDCVYPLDTALALERDQDRLAGIEIIAEDGSGIAQARVIAGLYHGWQALTDIQQRHAKRARWQRLHAGVSRWQPQAQPARGAPQS
jgi:hypothetical protein